MAEVYRPAEDSWLLEQCIVKESLKGKKCLDIGCGCGIQSVAMLKSGAKEVVSVDVNETALTVTKVAVESYIKGLEENMTQIVGHSLFYSIIESNLFSNIEGKFDFIAFNPPYVPSDEIKWSDLDGGENGREVIDAFVETVDSHLTENGVIMLLLSSLNNIDDVSKTLSKKGYDVKNRGNKKLFFEELVVLRAEK